VPSRDPTQRFEDILENIAPIEEFTAGMDLTAFTENLKANHFAMRSNSRFFSACRRSY